MSERTRSGGAVEFLGLRFDRLDQDQVIRILRQRHEAKRFAYVVTPNVDHIVALSKLAPNHAVRTAYREADLTLCDSRILKKLARWSGLQLSLVTGSDLTVRLLCELQESGGGRVALIGGSEAMLEDLCRIYPAIAWQQHIPPMGVRQNADLQQEIVHYIENGVADYVLFAIGAPQSELLCAMIAQRGKAMGWALCIGASLEFATGVKKRAPKVMQRLSLEWLFRLLSEPKRLWRRYLVDGPKIVPVWLQWRASRPRLRGGSVASRYDPS